MLRPPRKPGESLFAGGMLYQVLLNGIVLAAAALAAQFWASEQGYDVRTQQSLVFTVLCFAQLANALSVRSVYKPVFSVSLLVNPLLIGSVLLTVLLQLALVYVPAVQQLFKTTGLDKDLLIAVLILTVGSLVLIEIIKLVFYKMIYAKKIKT